MGHDKVSIAIRQPEITVCAFSGCQIIGAGWTGVQFRLGAGLSGASDFRLPRGWFAPKRTHANLSLQKPRYAITSSPHFCSKITKEKRV
ncbi:hypothetical protein GCWU000324_00080 [Kingella oralis ATCC 51147]|uniref:Uncharacterized protein n=1 Tax=Kingella oralis ATCC 51147 TaxID=629741 RepID=C4GEJ4_9NEIS|nr:hypothetical protein GCWU000324_00080 [Kingella oralis ATCC 51147]